MMSLSSGMSAGQAGGYFSREDYYLKGADQGEHSRWYGKGAQSLGLSGPVGEEEFRALCTGRHPASGEQLVAPGHGRDRKTGNQVEVRRAGNDCTYSPAKSVSAAYAAGVPGIREAHDAAVSAALRHQEEHYSWYRSPDGAKRGGLVAAVFTHATSRSLDPQLHSHVFVINAVSSPDGGWRANWNRPVFRDQKSLGLLYRQELARELRERGFAIRFSDRSQMFYELKGVDPQLVEALSSRREAIEHQVGLWKGEGRFAGVPHGRLYEMAALETRDAKRKVSREDVVRAFERGFESCGTTTLEVRRGLERSRELELGRDRSPPEYSASQAVRLAAERLVEREAVLERANILDQAVLISGGRHGVQELNDALDGGKDFLVRLGEDGRGREYYTTVEMQRVEARNLETVRGLAGFRSVTGREEVEAYFGRLEEEGGVRYTAGQKEHVLNELTGERSVAVSDGRAGTGKTVAAQILERFNREVLQPRGEIHYSINAAFTARAAQEMEQASGRPGFTVDALLNARARGEVRLQREFDAPPRLVVAGEEILISEGVQVVLRVDEASMLGARQAGHLLQMVQELQDQGVPVKLQLIGDTRQMQAIQAGDLFRQALELGKEGWTDVARLNEIRRQRDPGLLEIVKQLNREDRLPGESAREALQSLHVTERVIVRERREELIAASVREYREQSAKPSNDVEKARAGERQSVLLIASTNADRKELNRAIREARIKAGEIGEGRAFRVLTPATAGVTADGYREGEEIVFSGYRGEDGKMQRWEARLNTVATVTGIDPERNRVAVSYAFTTKRGNGEVIRKSVTKSLPAAEMAGRITVYREEQRNFAPGDRVVALKNDRELGVQNGSLGVLRSFDAEGRAVVQFGRKEMVLDLDRYRHIDHAYAVTLHKSQGATVEHSILYAPVRPGAGECMAPDGASPPGGESYARASYNALNVAVTRARYGATVLTNSLSALAREVEHLDMKSSSLDPIAAVKDAGVPVPGTRPPLQERPGPGHPPEVSVTVTGGGEKERTGPGRSPGGAGKREVPSEVVSGPAMTQLQGASQTPSGAHAKHPSVPAREKFDRGAKFGKRVDELARAGEPAQRALNEQLRNLGRPLPGVGREIVKQAPRIAVKGMDIDI